MRLNPKVHSNQSPSSLGQAPVVSGSGAAGTAQTRDVRGAKTAQSADTYELAPQRPRPPARHKMGLVDTIGSHIMLGVVMSLPAVGLAGPWGAAAMAALGGALGVGRYIRDR